jgi:peptide/nickel transport system permease protein
MNSSAAEFKEPGRFATFLRKSGGGSPGRTHCRPGRLVVILGYAVIVACAPWLAPYGESDIFPQAFAPWSEEFPFGTDNLGRDILTRLIYGIRNTVLISLAATLVAFGIGASLGTLAALAPKWLDQLMSRLGR